MADFNPCRSSEMADFKSTSLISIKVEKELNLDVQTQCNFFVKYCSNKSVQVTLGKRRNENDNLFEKKRSRAWPEEVTGSRRIKMEYPIESPQEENIIADGLVIDSNLGKLDRVIIWLTKLLERKEISPCVSFHEKFCLNSGKRFLEITRSDIIVPELGSEPIKYFLDDEGEVSVFVAYKGLHKDEKLFNNEEFLEENAHLVFKRIFEDGYRFCSGLSEEVKSKLKAIQYNPKNVTSFNEPLPRTSSSLCLVWYKPSKYASTKFSNVLIQCVPCRNISTHLKTLGLKGPKNLYESTSSKCPIKYLSPSSLSVRFNKLRAKNRSLNQSNKKLLEKCEKMKEELEINLSSKHSADLQNVARVINKDFSLDLLKLLQENPETSSTLKEIWEADCLDQGQTEDSTEFGEDQLKNSN